LHADRRSTALSLLSDAVREVEAALAEMREQRDPLGLHVYLSRRHYRQMSDTKGGKRHAQFARTSYDRATDLGFGGRFEEWLRLLQAVSRG
jgi:hypothetical protein